MNNNEQGIVREGTTDVAEGVNHFLVLWTFSAGTMPYDTLVEHALSRGWSRDEVPVMRTLTNAHNVAKNVLSELSNHLPVLEELEGWDGMVTQELKVETLTRNSEYRISVRRRGRMNGRDHIEDIPTIRVRFSPPTDFDQSSWRNNYIESAWNPEVERDVSGYQRLNECISMESYWEETRVDVSLMNTIRERVLTTFREEATSVDHKKLKDLVESTVKGGHGRGRLSSGLGGIRYRRQGSVYLVRVSATHGNATAAETLDRLEQLVTLFARSNQRRHRWYTQGNTITTMAKTTSFSVLQLVDNARELEYIRESIVDEAIQAQAQFLNEEANYLRERNEALESMTAENAAEILEKLEQMQNDRMTSTSRYQEWADDAGVEFSMQEADYSEIEAQLGEQVTTLSRFRVDEAGQSPVDTIVNMFQSRTTPRIRLDD